MKEKGKILADIARYGPKRVMIDENGTSMPPETAERVHEIKPEIILVRDDGWSIGCEIYLQNELYELYPDMWIGFMFPGSSELRPMEEF